MQRPGVMAPAVLGELEVRRGHLSESSGERMRLARSRWRPRHRELLLLRLPSMPDEFSAIPLADVLRAANELVSAGLIKDYALGGALAAIYYTEPITT